MKKDFQDKVVLITGASSGIGKACAMELSHRGAKLALAARRVDELEKLVRELPTEAIAIPTDVTSQEDCKHFVERAKEHFGKIDVLINNAGISMRALFKDLDVEVLKRVMDVNFWGTVYCTKYALPEIIKSKGSIAGISSIAGYRGLPGRTGYSSSKFAMHGFLESLRTELLQQDVHVLLACPGFTASNIRSTALTASGKQQGDSPLEEGKLMPAEEVAAHIANAIKKRKRDLILTGQGKATVFMNKWLPGWMDKMVYKHFAKESDSPLK